MTDIQQLPLILDKRPQHGLYPAVTRLRSQEWRRGRRERESLLTETAEAEGQGWRGARKHEQETGGSRSDGEAYRHCVAEKEVVLTQQYTCSQLLRFHYRVQCDNTSEKKGWCQGEGTERDRGGGGGSEEGRDHEG